MLTWKDPHLQGFLQPFCDFSKRSCLQHVFRMLDLLSWREQDLSQRAVDRNPRHPRQRFLPQQEGQANRREIVLAEVPLEQFWRNDEWPDVQRLDQLLLQQKVQEDRLAIVLAEFPPEQLWRNPSWTDVQGQEGLLLQQEVQADRRPVGLVEVPLEQFWRRRNRFLPNLQQLEHRRLVYVAHPARQNGSICQVKGARQSLDEL